MFNCNWISSRKFTDVSLRLHLSGQAHVDLSDLVNTNSTALLAGPDAVNCGKCKIKTSQHSQRSYNDPDLFLIEIIRVMPDSKNRWVKNDAPLSFAVKNLHLPGFVRPYTVVGTCHHRGSLNGGHLTTKVFTKEGWFDMDDLKRDRVLASPPGVQDNTTSVILLIAVDRLPFL